MATKIPRLLSLVLGVVVAVTAALLIGVSSGSADVTGAQFRITTQGHDGNYQYRATKPDIAYDAQNDQHLVAYINEDPTNGYTIYGQLIDASGADVGTGFPISPLGTADSTGPPTVAYDGTNHQFLVVWDDDSYVYGQLVSTAGELVGSTITISSETYNDIETTDIAFDPDTGQYLVAWEGWNAITDYQVYGRLLAASDGTPAGTADLQISNIVSPGYSDDAMSAAYNSVDHQFLVVWKAYEPTGDTYEIFGQIVDPTGADLSSTDFQVSHTEGTYATRPRVAYDPANDRYLVVFVDESTSTQTEVFGQFVAADGSMDGATFQVSDGSGVSSSWGVFGPDIAYNETDGRYLVVFHANPWFSGGTSVGSEIYADYIAGDGTLKGERDFQISSMGEAYGAYRPAVDFNSTSGQFLPVWWADTDAEGLVSGEWEVWGRHVTGLEEANTKPPTTSIALDAEPNGNGWFTSDVGVTISSYGQYDGASDVQQTRCAVVPTFDPAPSTFDDLPDAPCDLTTVSDEGQWTIYAAAMDTAGNKGALVSQDVWLDKTAPSLSPSMSSGASFYLNQPVATPDPGATDSLSTIYSSGCGAVATSTLGSKTLLCEATDHAGNYNYAVVSYSVLLKAASFVSPTVATSWKVGHAVPIRVQLLDYYNAPVSSITGLSTSSCPVSVTATGAQTLSSTCLKYSKHLKAYSYSWRLARTGTGTATITATVKYDFTSTTTTNSVQINIVPAR